jgi:general secretion pathway protein G
MTRTHGRTKGFTLVEILIVVVILGILAAIVIPQFTNASEEAAESSVKSQLQTVRSQIELYRVKNLGALPVTNNLLDWALLVDADPPYLQSEPGNPLRGGATIVIASSGTPGATDGWGWNNDTGRLYAFDKDGALRTDW